VFHHRKLIFEHRPGGSRLMSRPITVHPNGVWFLLRYWLRHLRPATS
jgi:hypothetical protein